MRLRIFAVLVVGLACSAAVGQMTHCGMAMAPSGAAMATPAAALNKMLSVYEEELTGVVKAMPADKFNFAPNAATFVPGSTEKFDGVRTFAQQVQHLVQGNYFFFMNVTSVKPDIDMKTVGSMTSKEDLVKALAESFVYAHKAVDTITPGNAFVLIKGVDGMDTRATVAAFAVAHGFDHYGQMVEYLRMNGVVPPGSK